MSERAAPQPSGSTRGDREARKLTGGCQCGAVRFRADRLGRGSICHCRMCQKQFGSFYGPFVSGHGVAWTRGEPKYFRSSNRARRGFCANCGTPLTYEEDGSAVVELAMGAFDEPVAPTMQVNPQDKLPFVDGLAGLKTRMPGDEPARDAFYASVVSYQHPDRDTDNWVTKEPGV